MLKPSASEVHDASLPPPADAGEYHQTDDDVQIRTPTPAAGEAQDASLPPPAGLGKDQVQNNNPHEINNESQTDHQQCILDLSEHLPPNVPEDKMQPKRPLPDTNHFNSLSTKLSLTSDLPSTASTL